MGLLGLERGWELWSHSDALPDAGRTGRAAAPAERRSGSRRVARLSVRTLPAVLVGEKAMEELRARVATLEAEVAGLKAGLDEVNARSSRIDVAPGRDRAAIAVSADG